jgi:hypothetical protein
VKIVLLHLKYEIIFGVLLNVFSSNIAITIEEAVKERSKN